MNHVTSRVSDDDPVVSALAALLSDLPGELWDAGRVDAKLWDSALLSPARDIISRSGKGVRSRLLENSWILGGGEPGALPELLPVAIELLHVGSLVIDDIEDDSAMRRGEPTLHRRYGLPRALNTGNWLCFLSFACLSRLPLAPEDRLALHEEMSLGLVRCHQGQALDISISVAELPRADVYDVVSTTTRMKTGALMALAAVMGARAAGASKDTLEAIRAFGTDLGVGLQMLDDWSGVATSRRKDKGLEDLRLGSPTWPWAWLSRDINQVGYAELAHSARDASIEWEFERVRERIRVHLAPIAPRLIEEQLEGALEALRSAMDDGPELEAIAHDLDELSRAYG